MHPRPIWYLSVIMGRHLEAQVHVSGQVAHGAYRVCTPWVLTRTVDGAGPRVENDNACTVTLHGLPCCRRQIT